MLLDKVLELYLMLAELLCAVLAAKRLVCSLGEALGMELVSHFPSDEDYQGEAQKSPSIDAGNEQKRSEQHCKIPVIDTAGGAAAILHKPCLERAEEQNTDNIANAVSKGNHCQNILIDDAEAVEGKDCTVQQKPYCCYDKGGFGGLVLRLSFHLWRTVIAGKDLLASHTLKV